MPKYLIGKMKNAYIEEETFEKITTIPRGDYDNCTFINCVLANTDLSHSSFSECEFIGCDLSMANLTKTALKDVSFKECKLLGLHFDHCND
ncbi:MAG: pentapeptide repeat-containing protein, partial [Spirosomaceae bacterium]|nr:pentapeptide repeat-containing protein [Spirosomataceae bacterium]